MKHGLKKNRDRVTPQPVFARKNPAWMSVCALVAGGLLLAGTGSARAAAITWGAPANIGADGPNDVSTNGVALYAETWGSSGTTINGVTFTQDASQTGDANVAIAYTAGGVDRHGEGTGGSGTAYYALTSADSSYFALIQGTDWGANANPGTITLNNLTVGHGYQVEIWENDSRGGTYSGRNATLSSTNGNSVTLACYYGGNGATSPAGGLGQYAIGTFIASGANQVISITGGGINAADQINSIQVRDITPGAVNAACSTISPALVSLTANGASTQSITVQARDADNLNETTGGATVVFSLSGTGTLSATTDNGDGTYTVTLTAPTGAGLGTVTATLNGAAVGTAGGASQSAATYFSSNIGDAVPGLTGTLATNFMVGGATFQTVYYPAQGLGPIYNNSSCANCHNYPASGGGGSSMVMRFGLNANGVFNPLTNFDGPMLHTAFINGNCTETNGPETNAPISANVLAQRKTRMLFGDGLIEAIPASVIESNAALPNPDGIVGRVAMVTDINGQQLVGRFGWKAQYGSLLAFSANSANNELGRTSRIEPVGHAPYGNVSLYNAYNTVPDPNDVTNSTGKADIDRASDYIRLLGPAPTVPLTANALAGQALFHQISCDECHTPSLPTSAAFIPVSDLAIETNAPIAALSGKSVPLYSDLLLHNMGSLNDGIAQAAANTNQMMTAPLWGLRFKIPYLHDGRATNSVATAIREHGGDAAAAAVRYENLSTNQQQELVQFLNSL